MRTSTNIGGGGIKRLVLRSVELLRAPIHYIHVINGHNIRKVRGILSSVSSHFWPCLVAMGTVYLIPGYSSVCLFWWCWQCQEESLNLMIDRL